MEGLLLGGQKGKAESARCLGLQRGKARGLTFRLPKSSPDNYIVIIHVCARSTDMPNVHI